MVLWTCIEVDLGAIDGPDDVVLLIDESSIQVGSRSRGRRVQGNDAAAHKRLSRFAVNAAALQLGRVSAERTVIYMTHSEIEDRSSRTIAGVVGALGCRIIC